MKKTFLLLCFFVSSFELQAGSVQNNNVACEKRAKKLEKRIANLEKELTELQMISKTNCNECTSYYNEGPHEE